MWREREQTKTAATGEMLPGLKMKRLAIPIFEGSTFGD
jgi:hypothetical protein